MPVDAVQTLAAIALDQAAAGDGWAALAAQMAADTLVVGALLKKSDEALLDIGPLRALSLDSDVLSRVHDRYRQRIRQGLDGWSVGQEAADLLGATDLPGLPLHAGLAGEFAHQWLDDEDLEGAVAREQLRAARFAALGRRLETAGEHDGAAGCYRASDRAAFVAWHARASPEADVHLPLVRCAVLIAEHHAGDARPAAEFRSALDGMVLCGGTPDRHW